MKYKVGDVVKLRPRDDLFLLQPSSTIAICFGGKEMRVLNQDAFGDYLLEGINDGEPLYCKSTWIACKVQESKSPENNYSFDELQQKICEFKEYLEKVNNANDCCINVLFETTYSSERKVGTEFKIRKI